jgi:membrane protein DedA with SNARE-associated domain
MAGDRAFHGVLAAGVSGAGAPGLFGLLLMEAGVPVPIPGDLVLLLVGERVAAGALPLWTAVLALELVAVAGTAALFWLARGPGQALVTRVGPRVGLTGPRLARASALLVWWRRRAAAGRLLAEGCCPVCLVAGAAGLRRVRDEGTP